MTPVMTGERQSERRADRLTLTPVGVPAVPQGAAEIPLGALFAPWRRRVRASVAAVVVAWGAVAGLCVLPRDYAASMQLAAVPNPKTAALSGGISALLAAGQTGGLQATPRFVASLLGMRGVLLTVAALPARGGADPTGAAPARPEEPTVIERVLEKPAAKIAPAEVEPAMRRIVTTDVDKGTGVVTLAVTLPDSGLARRVALALSGAAERQYHAVSRAQATEQRAAVQARVDSAGRQLRRAEERLADFVATHRAYAVYADATLERARLERDVTNANLVNTQAIQDREQAVARELEEAPALVVVDGLPATLIPAPRHAVLKGFLATLLALGAVGAWGFVRGDGAAARRGGAAGGRGSDAARDAGRAGARAA